MNVLINLLIKTAEILFCIPQVFNKIRSYLTWCNLGIYKYELNWFDWLNNTRRNSYFEVLNSRAGVSKVWSRVILARGLIFFFCSPPTVIQEWYKFVPFSTEGWRRWRPLICSQCKIITNIMFLQWKMLSMFLSTRLWRCWCGTSAVAGKTEQHLHCRVTEQ